MGTETPSNETAESASSGLMRQILGKAGIDAPVTDDMTFHQFFWVVMRARNIASKAELHRVSGLQRRFLTRFASFDSQPKGGPARIWAEDDYRKMARALKIDEDLFVAIVAEAQGVPREEKNANGDEMPEESKTGRMETMSKQELMRQILEKAGIEFPVTVETTIGEFVRAVIEARKIHTQMELCEKTGLDRMFIVRIITYNVLPKTTRGRNCGDDRYRILAEALSLDADLFVRLITELQTVERGYLKKYERKNNEAVDGICRKYRIQLMRLLEVEPLQDAQEECGRERALEEMLRQFVLEANEARRRRD